MVHPNGAPAAVQNVRGVSSVAASSWERAARRGRSSRAGDLPDAAGLVARGVAGGRQDGGLATIGSMERRACHHPAWSLTLDVASHGRPARPPRAATRSRPRAGRSAGASSRRVASPARSPARSRSSTTPYAYQLREVTRCIQQGLTESPTMPPAETLATMRLFDEARRQMCVVYPNDLRVA